LEVLRDENFRSLWGMRVGAVTNHTGRTKDGTHLLDLLRAHPKVRLEALFGPEHGIWGDRPAGEEVESRLDPETGVKVWSLYGRTRKPTPDMLEGLDVLVFDVQDVGARFYTFLSTMSLAMEAAFQAGIPFFVLDRPNPITGTHIEGPVLRTRFSSFVGLHPIPIRHGMTLGELALMIADRWLSVRGKLEVVRMEGWRRDMWWEETGWPWRNPSPNMPSPSAALCYPGTCLAEGTNLSEGRGTEEPFERIGAPWVRGSELAEELNARGLDGIVFRPISFVPEPLPSAPNPKYKGVKCEGVLLAVTDKEAFQPVRTGVHILSAVGKLFPEFTFYDDRFDRLAGTEDLRRAIVDGRDPEDIVAGWEDELEAFQDLRKEYLLYT